MKQFSATNTIGNRGDQSINEQSLSIREEDKGRIIRYLVKDAYSDPIRTAIQEYICNARDAHRERGNTDKPIEITLPCNENPSIYIRDFGLGISPDRMWNIFAYIGASTKRDSNSQTGGFGLGSKTAFAYTDIFNVRTGTREDDNTVTVRDYILCYENDNISIEEVNTATNATESDIGTTISFGISNSDRSYVEDNIRRVCMHWDVKPVITNCDFSYSTFDTMFNSDNISISTQYKSDDVIILLDDIPYKMPIKQINQSINRIKDNEELYHAVDNILMNLNYQVVFKASTGELIPTIDRSNIDFGHTKLVDRFTRRIAKYLNELYDEYSSTIASCKSYREACKIYSTSHVFNSNIDFKWNNILLRNSINFTEKICTRVCKQDVEASSVSRIKTSSIETKRIILFDSTPSRSVPIPRLRTVLAHFKLKTYECVYVVDNEKFNLHYRYHEDRLNSDYSKGKLRELDTLKALSVGDINDFEPTKLPSKKKDKSAGYKTITSTGRGTISDLDINNDRFLWVTLRGNYKDYFYKLGYTYREELFKIMKLYGWEHVVILPAHAYNSKKLKNNKNAINFHDFLYNKDIIKLIVDCIARKTKYKPVKIIKENRIDQYNVNIAHITIKKLKKRIFKNSSDTLNELYDFMDQYYKYYEIVNGDSWDFNRVIERFSDYSLSIRSMFSEVIESKSVIYDVSYYQEKYKWADTIIRRCGTNGSSLYTMLHYYIKMIEENKKIKQQLKNKKKWRCRQR